MDWDKYRYTKEMPRRRVPSCIACELGFPGAVTVLKSGYPAQLECNVNYCPSCGQFVKDHLMAQIHNYYRQMYECEREKRDIERTFIADALKEVGLEGHPKAEKIVALAKRNASSGTYAEIFTELKLIAEVLL